MNPQAFSTLHRNLPREGPGEPADIEWLGRQISLPEGARICDLACGPGPDIGPLLQLAPEATVVAIDHNPQYLGEAAEEWAGDWRVDLRLGDMADPGGPYDLIWCAGGVYFLGITEALERWRDSLAPGGVIAFTEPCFWRDPPSEVVAHIWSGYPAMSGEAGIRARIEAADYEVIATRRLADSAWQAYYGPLLERMNALYEGADEDLLEVLRAAAAEIAAWDEYGDEFGYLLSVVRPA